MNDYRDRFISVSDAFYLIGEHLNLAETHTEKKKIDRLRENLDEILREVNHVLAVMVLGYFISEDKERKDRDSEYAQ